MDRTVPAPAASLLDFIRKTEVGRTDRASYDVIYGHNQKRLTKPITQMTVAELQGHQSGFKEAFGSSASGAYQFMKDTLGDLRRELGLGDGQIFDPDLQDRLGYHLLRRRGYDQWIKGTLSDDQFMINLAKEWASFPVPFDMQGHKRRVSRGQSFYVGVGNNKALTSVETMRTQLHKARNAVMPAPTPTPIPPAPLPDKPKPWYLSQTVIGIAVAVIGPIIGRWFPALADQATLTSWITWTLENIVPFVGGAIAVHGRVTATSPIKGTKAADKATETLERAINAPSPIYQPEPNYSPLERVDEDVREVVDSIKHEPLRLEDMKLSDLVEQVPRVLAMFGKLRNDLDKVQNLQLSPPKKKKPPSLGEQPQE